MHFGIPETSKLQISLKINLTHLLISFQLVQINHKNLNQVTHHKSMTIFSTPNQKNNRTK